MAKVKILIPFRVEIEGKAVEFTPGDSELPDHLLDAFTSCGYVSLLSKPAIKVVHKPETGKAVK